jgi:hypothetical protein
MVSILIQSISWVQSPNKDYKVAAIDKHTTIRITSKDWQVHNGDDILDQSNLSMCGLVLDR